MSGTGQIAHQRGLLILLLGMPLSASAHGADVLPVVYAHLGSAAACLLALWWLPFLRRHRWWGAAGCAAGVVLAVGSTMDLPFQAHKGLILVAAAFSPFIGGMGVVGLRLAWTRRMRAGGPPS
ncbi:hypothetical protein HNP48_002895 [Acidovorax soli]|uniref:MerC mercury resistance protein n=1 Tax=Acidovorax soli TaxID=592050 RepID=A0A7X0U9J3_9BURK|nr:hypothetical protein [Acidovorax soli]MBB6560221.1 hypothetical protein [Acidovorax soli]